MSKTDPAVENATDTRLRFDDASGETISLEERLVLAPCTGKFEPAPPQHFTAEGEYVLAGQLVGYVIAGGERVAIVSGFSGWVMGYLAHDRQPVRASQPVLWLRRL